VRGITWWAYVGCKCNHEPAGKSTAASPARACDHRKRNANPQHHPKGLGRPVLIIIININIIIIININININFRLIVIIIIIVGVVVGVVAVVVVIAHFELV
jgi:hypothetical protein